MSKMQFLEIKWKNLSSLRSVCHQREIAPKFIELDRQKGSETRYHELHTTLQRQRQSVCSPLLPLYKVCLEDDTIGASVGRRYRALSQGDRRSKTDGQASSSRIVRRPSSKNIITDTQRKLLPCKMEIFAVVFIALDRFSQRRCFLPRKRGH